MKKFLSVLLAIIMLVGIMPCQIPAATDLPFSGNKIDITDASAGPYTIQYLEIYYQNSYDPVTIISANQDGKTINVVLSADTDPSATLQAGLSGSSMGGVLQSSGNTCTLQNGTGTISYSFAVIAGGRPQARGEYKINISTQTGESVSVTPPEGEGFTFSGKDSAYKDGPYTFTIKANTGYDGSDMVVKVNGEVLVGIEGTYTVDNVSEALTITVEGVVKKQSFIVILPQGEGFSVVGADIAYKDDNYTFTVSVNDGYEQSAMVVKVNNNIIIGTNGAYTVETVSGDMTITVENVLPKTVFDITPPLGDGFTFNGNATVYEGDNYTFTVTPNTGLVAIVKVNGDVISSSDNSYTVNSVSCHLVITVALERAPLPDTKLTVDNNTIDIEDATIYSLNNYYAKATNIKISGATVTSAYEDGKTVYILLAAGTAGNGRIDIEFGTSLKSCTMSGYKTSYTLSDGEGSLNMTLTGTYVSSLKGSATYTLIFIREEATNIPSRIIESDSKETYKSTAIDILISDYFTEATRFYLATDGTKTLIDGGYFNFRAEEPGVYTFVFSAENDIGECPDTVTVTVTVTDIEGGIWLGHTTSSGSLNYVYFVDESGNLINGIEVSYNDKQVKAILPKTYPVNGKIKAIFNLTRNESGYPFLSTKTDKVGSTPATNYKFAERESTLNKGTATFTFYYFNSSPTGSNHETFQITYTVKNDKPILADGINNTATSSITAGESYTLDLAPIFTDADGDSLTYKVSINGASPVNADANYTFTTDVAGEYLLVFTANDTKADSDDTYTVALTVENSTETNSMTVYLPENLNPRFYVCSGFSEGIDIQGDALDAVIGETSEGITPYTLTYPINAEMLSVRTNDFGGISFLAEKDGAVSLRRAKFEVVDYDNNTADCTYSITYGENTAVAGSNGWLLAVGAEYIFTATPTNTDLKKNTNTVTMDAGADIYIAQMILGLSNPMSITIPSGARAHLYKYIQYYSNRELDAKIIRDNGDGTITYQFIADTTAHGASYIYRVSMEGKITKSGWLAWNQQNLTITYTEDDKLPSYRLNDYSTTGEANSEITEDSVLLNANSRNHLNLSPGQSTTLKAYRAWEIIPVSYNNYIITPDFTYTVLQGNDIISLTEKESPSAGEGDWMTLTALKEGIAIIEVSYDAIKISGGNYDGVYGASDPDRTGLLVVQVGENNDSSVKFGIDSFSSHGISGTTNISYNPNRQKEWDAEFDTLYFIGNSGNITLNPTASSDILEVSVSNDKGTTWTILGSENSIYNAEILPGNNIIRVKTANGTAYQVVRGDKITVRFTEVSDKSDGDGIVEAGETIRVTLVGLHSPIPKMAGNYNPGFGGNDDGYSSQHLNYTCNGTNIYGSGLQYNFITSANFVEIVMPDDGSGVTLNNGYIGTGVIGLTSFSNGGDSHRNIPESGCTTRGSGTTYHTQSILPEISILAGDTSAPNNAPIVRKDAVSEKEIYEDQNFAINPETLFTDPDDDTLTFTVSVNDAEAVDAPADYMFIPGSVGTYKLLFTATDGKETVQHTIILTATKRPSQGGLGSDTDNGFGLSASEIAGYVTISFVDKGIRVAGESGLKYPKALGTIISATRVPYKNGEKITHVTKRLLDKLRIRMSYSGTLESGFYLGAICDFELKGTPYDSFGEFDAGVGSGWMITLNNTFIEYGASEFEVKNGDVIKWQYTCQLGKDIGDTFYSSSSSSSSGRNNKKDNDKKEETEEPKEQINEEQKEETTKNTFTETTFADVKKDDWHYDSVKYVYENNLMQGTGNSFEPDSKMTRAMLVTVLYRMANPNGTEDIHTFTDVPEGQWYSDAVAWAASKGIVCGVSETEFAPDADITREQMALIIYRYAMMQSIDVTDTSNLESFSDTDAISDWAVDALKWANSVAIVTGTSDTTLSPKDTATRAQVAAILMRFCENVAK